MIVSTNSNEIFYVLTIVAVGAGLYIPHTLRKSSGSISLTETPMHINFVRVLLYFMVVLNSLVIMMPMVRAPFYTDSLNYLVIIPLVVSVLLWKNLISGAEKFSRPSLKIGKLLMSAHGLLFLGVIQVLVLLQIANAVLVQFFGESNYSILISMIILAGIFTLAGGLNVVMYTTIFAGCIFFAGILFALFVPSTFNNQMLNLFSNVFRAESEVFQYNGASDVNIVLTVAGFVMITVWLMLIVHGNFSYVKSVYLNFFGRESKIAIGVILATFAMLYFLTLLYGNVFSTQEQSVFFPGNFESTLFACCWLIMLTGMFAVSFHQFGSLVSRQMLYADSMRNNEEKQILIKKLATVVAVLLAVFLISFVKMTGSSVLVYVVNFMVFFSTPIAASFLLFVVMKKEYAAGLSAGVIIGEIVAGIEFFSRTTLIFNPKNIYAYALDISIVTIVASIVIVLSFKLKMLQKLTHANRIAESSR